VAFDPFAVLIAEADAQHRQVQAGDVIRSRMQTRTSLSAAIVGKRWCQLRLFCCADGRRRACGAVDDRNLYDWP